MMPKDFGREVGKTWYCRCGAALLTVWNDPNVYTCRRCGSPMTENPEESRCQAPPSVLSPTAAS